MAGAPPLASVPGAGAGAGPGPTAARASPATGALGAAVGYGLYDIAFILSATTFLTLRCSRPLKRATNGDVGTSASP